MTIQALLILNSNGDVLLHRNFTQTLTPSLIHEIRLRILSGQINSPILFFQQKIFVNMRKQHHFVFLQIDGSDCIAPIVFIEQFWACISVLLKAKNGEVKIAENQLILQEIVDLMVDNGQVSTTDPEVIRLFIEVPKVVKGQMVEAVTVQATKQVNYRPQNIHYMKDQIFMDIEETISATISQTGQLLLCGIQGEILTNSQLSGMPTCCVKFSQKNLHNIKFHQCVNIGQYVNSNTINFIPPDGKFVLLRYEIQDNANLPLKINVIYRAISKTKAEVQIDIFNLLHEQTINKLLLRIPLPESIQKVNVQSVKQGKMRQVSQFMHYSNQEIAESEHIKLLFSIETDFQNKIDLREWLKPAIDVKFEIIQCNCSGLSVKSLDIQSKDQKSVIKWVRQKMFGDNYFIKW